MDKYKENVKGKIRQFSKYLGQKTWFTGGEVNLSNIHIYIYIYIYI